MLYKGAKPAALYRGAYKPGKLYKGTQLVAGYADVSKAAPASWDGTYDDVVGVAAQGRGKQQTYSGKNLLDDAAMRTYGNWRDDIPGTTGANMGFVIINEPGTYTLSWTQPEDRSFPDFFYVYVVDADGGFDYFYLTTNTVVNLSYTITVPAGGYAYVRLTGIGSEGGFRDAIAKIATIQLEAGSTATAYEPDVGGQPSPSPDYPQPLVASEGTLTASGRTGTTPTTVTLPVLRAIPGTDIRDTLTYIGNGQWQVTRRVGVVQLTGTETWVVGGQYREDKMDWYYVSAKLPDAVDSSDAPCACTHYPHNEIVNNQTKQGFAIVWRAIRVRWGDPPDDTAAWKAFLAEQVAAGDPVTIWYALATPTTETLTLGTLPSYPVHMKLDVSGDYPPDVTGTVKVGT